ncbi:hypothetical protein SDC9_15095 [bioreactor metagenome]|uniref:5-oxoprolinase subunit A n=1 Tax=bioreactor metagenome TaxID=1076179 RepID=A0A644TQU4_9ZZZZ|nr:LamB/YcsF family protein [Negativicutes bacterium]
MARYVDLNSDLGESFGAYTLGLDRDVLRHISSANIACGCHAGDPMVMAKTVGLAQELGVSIGAHPGFPDLVGFGRRKMALSPVEVKNYIIYQVGALAAFAAAANTKLQHVKPHGALYNMAAVDPKFAIAIAEGIAEVNTELIFVGLAGSEMIKAGQQAGLRVASEVFADRGYNSDGTLIARGQPGAMIHDPEEAAVRVVKMVAKGTIMSAGGQEIAICADTVCLHGDSPGAVEMAQTIRKRLEEAGIKISPLGGEIS